jgi:AcrR family transcriptional regulator
MTTLEKKPSGRQLDEEIGHRVTAAAWRLLADKSLAALTIMEIADLAGTSRPAIYRRWHSVDEIAIDAVLDQVTEIVRADDTLSPPDALRTYIVSLGRFLSGRVGRAIAEILGRAQSDPDLMERFHAGFLRRRRDNARSLIERGQREGYFRADLDSELIIDLYAGPIYFRAFARHAPLDEAFTRSLAEQVLLTIGTRNGS